MKHWPHSGSVNHPEGNNRRCDTTHWAAGLAALLMKASRNYHRSCPDPGGSVKWVRRRTIRSGGW